MAIALFWLAFEFHLYNKNNKVEISTGTGPRLVFNKSNGNVYVLDSKKIKESRVEDWEDLKK